MSHPNRTCPIKGVEAPAAVSLMPRCWGSAASLSLRLMSRRRKPTHQIPQHKLEQAGIVEVGYCAATRYHDKLNEIQQQYAQLISLLESLCYRVDILPMLLGNTGEIFHSTLTNIKNTGADADRVDKLASRLSLHAQHTMQSIIQSRRVM